METQLERLHELVGAEEAQKLAVAAQASLLALNMLIEMHGRAVEAKHGPEVRKLYDALVLGGVKFTAEAEAMAEDAVKALGGAVRARATAQNN